MTKYQLAIIGAGPAGMAAAIEARESGLSVVVIDEQSQPGGQIYRAIERATPERLAIMGPEYTKGAALAQDFRASGAEYLPSTLLWNVEREEGSFLLDISTAAGSRRLGAMRIIVATGALERPVPIPGWTLPGVTTAGALQILLKAHGGVAEDAVLVGAGPLLLLLAHQMVLAGMPPRAVVEIGSADRLRQALPHLTKALRGWRYLVKGAQMLWSLRRAGVPYHKAASNVAIEGETEARAVTFTAGGCDHRIETPHIALHMGVVPNNQLTLMLRCEHEWNPCQYGFVPRVNPFFETTEAGVFVVGDGAGIGGATSAALRGRLAARRVAALEGVAGADSGIAALRRALASDAAVRPFLETLYAVSDDILSPPDETIICRCEEVTAGTIRQSVRDGAPGPNQVKAFLRCGMGPCQGRTCGLAVTTLVARERGVSEADVGYFRIRPPLKPLLITELAEIAAE